MARLSAIPPVWSGRVPRASTIYRR